MRASYCAKLKISFKAILPNLHSFPLTSDKAVKLRHWECILRWQWFSLLNSHLVVTWTSEKPIWNFLTLILGRIQWIPRMRFTHCIPRLHAGIHSPRFEWIMVSLVKPSHWNCQWLLFHWRTHQHVLDGLVQSFDSFSLWHRLKFTDSSISQDPGILGILVISHVKEVCKTFFGFQIPWSWQWKPQLSC